MMLAALLWMLLWALWLLWLASAKRPAVAANKELAEYAVVIPARNEADQILATLQSVLNQSPPPAAIFVMNDHSTDDTANLVQTFGHPKVFLHHTKGSGKKNALREGYQRAATFPWVLFTDADARWLPGAAAQLLQAGNAPKTAMVCGEVAYQSGFHPAAAFARADMEGMMRTARGLALRGFPFVCSGACLALRPAVVGADLPDLGPGDSGDDVFLLHALTATHGRDSIAWLDQTAVEVSAMPNFRTLWETRLRWAGKTSRYTQATARAVSLWIWLMHLTGLVLMFFQPLWILGGKTLLDLVFFGKKMSGRHLLTSWIYWLYIPLLPLISWFVAVSWKQRTVQKA